MPSFTDLTVTDYAVVGGELSVYGNTTLTARLSQGVQHMSGHQGWSSLSYNAYHDARHETWVFPDTTRPALTVEMDDHGGVPRFQVWSTTTSNPTTFARCLAVNGNSGALDIGNPDGDIGELLLQGRSALQGDTSQLRLNQNQAFSDGVLVDSLLKTKGPLTALVDDNVNPWPPNWGGGRGVHTWDLYAGGELGVGRLDAAGRPSAIVHHDGSMTLKSLTIDAGATITGQATVLGDLTVSGQLVVQGNLTVNGVIKGARWEGLPQPQPGQPAPQPGPYR